MDTLYTAEQKDQFIALLDTYPQEVAGLRAAIVEGRIDGMSYWDQRTDCGCVIGTIAHMRGVSETEIRFYVDVCYEYSPIEDLVMDISKGDTPATNPVPALLLAWIDERQPVVDGQGEAK